MSQSWLLDNKSSLRLIEWDCKMYFMNKKPYQPTFFFSSSLLFLKTPRLTVWTSYWMNGPQRTAVSRKELKVNRRFPNIFLFTERKDAWKDGQTISSSYSRQAVNSLCETITGIVVKMSSLWNPWAVKITTFQPLLFDFTNLTYSLAHQDWMSIWASL